MRQAGRRLSNHLVSGKVHARILRARGLRSGCTNQVVAVPTVLSSKRISLVALSPGKQRVARGPVCATQVIVMNRLRDRLNTGSIGHCVQQTFRTGQLIGAFDRRSQLLLNAVSHVSHIRVETLHARLVRFDDFHQFLAQFRNTLTCHRRHELDFCVLYSVCFEKAFQVLTRCLLLFRIQAVNLVEHHQHIVCVLRELPQIT